MQRLLKNKNILISGIGKGLGKDMLVKCVDSGAFVYGFTRTKKDIKDLKGKYLNNTKIFIGDATDEKFIKKIFIFLTKNKIVLHGLINNAGERQRKSFSKIKEKDIRHIMNVNFISVFSITQKFVKQLKKNNFASIINVGSIVGEKGFSDQNLLLRDLQKAYRLNYLQKVIKLELIQLIQVSQKPPILKSLRIRKIFILGRLKKFQLEDGER